MPIISVEIMKIIDERERSYPKCVVWDEVIAKCYKDSKECRQLASEIMKIVDERETQKTFKDRKEQGRTEAIVKG